MICPHCGKDTEAVYVDNIKKTKEQAVSELNRINKQLDAISAANPNLHESFVKSDAEERFDKLLKKANDLEVALGY